MLGFTVVLSGLKHHGLNFQWPTNPQVLGLQAGDVHGRVRAEPFASSEEYELEVSEKFENIREVN